MELGSKIFVAGHTGLVGSAIRRRLETLGYGRLLLRTSDELDLTRQEGVEEFFSWERPDYIFLAATYTGEVTNSCSSADLLYQGLATEFNIITSAHQSGAKRLLFLGTTCFYPRWIQKSFDEASHLFGQMESINRMHDIARTTGIELCDAYNREHGCRFLAVTASNQYGSSRAFDLNNSHLIPEMILKLHHAKVSGEYEVLLPGSANMRRGFLYSDDLANACVSLMNLNNHEFESLVSTPSGPVISIGCEEEFTVRELAQLVADVVMFRGRLRFDTSDPDDDSRILLDVPREKTLRWHSQTSLKERLQQAYKDFMLQTQETECESSDNPFYWTGAQREVSPPMKVKT